MTALNELHVYGEEFVQKFSWRQDEITRNTTIEIALFDADDANNGITVTDTTDVGDLSTEPTTGNYARQTVTLDSGDFNLFENGNGNWEIDIADQVFDVENTSSGVLNAYAVIGTFVSETAGDSSAQKHVLFTGDASPERALQGTREITLDNASLEIE